MLWMILQFWHLRLDYKNGQLTKLKYFNLTSLFRTKQKQSWDQKYLGNDLNKNITIKEEGSINNCLNAHFPDWKTTPVEDLTLSALPPTPPRMSKSDTMLDNIVLTGSERTLYQQKLGDPYRTGINVCLQS